MQFSPIDLYIDRDNEVYTTSILHFSWPDGDTSLLEIGHDSRRGIVFELLYYRFLRDQYTRLRDKITGE